MCYPKIQPMSSIEAKNKGRSFVSPAYRTRVGGQKVEQS